MNASLRSAAALLLLVGMPAATFAQTHNGQAPPPPRPAPAPARAPAPPRPAAPPPRPPAPPPKQVPVAKPPPPPPHGFSLPHDTNVQPIPVKPAPPITHHETVAQPPATKARVQPPPKNYKPATFYGNVHYGPYWNRFHGPVIINPHRWHGWGWNNGVAWNAAPIYWGGGFWGPFALSGLSGYTPYGWFLDTQNQYYYPSYQILQTSPGEQLLLNYSLQQTECGQPNLVVIWGPQNSVICAYPNNLVAAGNYQVNPTDLTLVSMI